MNAVSIRVARPNYSNYGNIEVFVVYLLPARAGDCTRCGRPRWSALLFPFDSRRARAWRRTSGYWDTPMTTCPADNGRQRLNRSRRRRCRGCLLLRHRRTKIPPPRHRGRRRARRTWGRRRPPPLRTLSRGRRLHPICGRTSERAAARRWPSAESVTTTTAHWSALHDRTLPSDSHNQQSANVNGTSKRRTTGIVRVTYGSRNDGKWDVSGVRGWDSEGWFSIETEQRLSQFFSTYSLGYHFYTFKLIIITRCVRAWYNSSTIRER